MKAIVYRDFAGTLTLEQVPDPAMPPDGVVIRVQASGICRSDWHGWMGHDPDIQLPHVPGHEFSGTVEEVGPHVQCWRPGDRVTVPFAVGCGVCPQCAAGQQHICDQYFQPGFTGWGSFAERVAIPHADGNLVRLPDELDFVAAASLGCRFTTAFRAVAVQGRPAPGQWLAVHGCGGVGLAAIMIGHAMGARIVAVDVKPAALRAAQALGAGATVDATLEADVPKRIQELTGGGAHVSIDALGSRPTCRSSILCLRKRGRHVQVGLMLAEDSDVFLPMAPVIGRELEIYGSHGMQAHAYGSLLALIQAGRLQPARLVTKTIPLSEAPEEMEALGKFQVDGVAVITQF